MKIKHLLLFLAAICVFSGSGLNAQSYAITNARVVTVSGPTIEKGTVVIRDGVIISVGTDVRPPADAQVFDATGLTVYPGFIDSLTNLGLAQTRPAAPIGGGPAAAAAAAAAAQQPPTSNSNYPAGLRPEEAAMTELRAGEAQFDSVRNAGFTTVLTTGRTGIFNGQSLVVNLAGDSVSTMVVKEPFAQHVSFTTLGATYPQSLLGTFAALRQMFLDARRLQETQRIYAADPKGIRRPASDKSLEALFPAINGQMPVVFNAQNEIQIIRALDLIKELKLKGIIAGGQEAGSISNRLKAANVPVLLSLNFPKRTAAASPDADSEPMDTLRLRAETPKVAGKLAAAGVRFAFQSGALTSINDFFANAGKAVEAGLSREAAVRAMTLSAAEILGVNDRLGSIEVGKIANLTLVKGDLFGRDKFVPQIIIDGKVFEQKEPPRPVAGGPRGQGGGQGTAGTPAANAANIGGVYSINIEIPGQALSATLTFVQSGSAFTGTMVSQLGTTPFSDGRVSGNNFTFSGAVQFGGANLDITVSGRVSGNEISGTVTTPQGPANFTGTKTP